MIWCSKDGKAFVVFSLHMLYLLDENLNCFLRNLKCDINAAELGIDRCLKVVLVLLKLDLVFMDII